MGEMLSYRQAARRVKRSIRSINRWRRGGMPMSWEVREGQRVRVVDEETLLKWWRDRLTAWPVHQQRLRKMRAEEEARHADDSD